jgi:hypothetical protein
MAVEPLTKVDIGIIKKVTFISKEHVYYTVFLENYHQENQRAEGIPIFSFGYNTYTYEVGSRVICLIKDKDFNKVFVLGQTYDPNLVRGIDAAKEGELNISSDQNGIIGIGTSDSISINSGSSKVKVTDEKISLTIGSTAKINLNPQEFSTTLNNGNNFSVKNGTADFNLNNGFKVRSAAGDIYLQGGSLSFAEGEGQTPSLLIVNSVHRYIGSEFLSIFSAYSFEAGTSKIKGKKNAVDWNIIQGNYAITIGVGDFVLKTGTTVIDKLTLGNGELNLSVGNILFYQTELLISGDEMKLNLNGAFSSSEINVKSSLVEIKNKVSLLLIDYDSSIKLDFGVITLTPSSKAKGGKIKLDGEVEITGSLIVRGSDGVSATLGDVTAGTISKISLKNHKHATSVPGSPSPPLPG